MKPLHLSRFAQPVVLAAAVALIFLTAGPPEVHAQSLSPDGFDPKAVFQAMELRVEVEKLGEQGQTEAAAAKGEDLLRLLTTLHGADDYETLNWQSNLAEIYLANGNAAKALPHFEAVLEGCRKAEGSTELTCLEPLSNVARCHLELADYAKAAELQAQCVAVFEKFPDQPAELVVLHVARLGVIYWQMGERDSALPHYEKCLELSLEQHGQDHAQTIITKNNLGTLHMEMGNLDLALPFLESSTATATAVLGEDSPTLIPMLNNLGELYEKKKEADLAKATYERSLALSLAIHGETSIEAATAMINLGHVETALEHDAEAVQMFNRSFGLLKSLLENEAADRPAILRQLGRCYHGLGQPDDAEDFLKQSITLYEVQRGVAHPHTREAREELASFFDYVGRFDEAQSLREKNKTTPDGEHS